MVAYGREVFFGQGILEAKPGTTHHGQPQQIIDCGKTEIDETTFNEYIASLQEMYTPDAYHLIEFNCNHFTADVVGFLTGAEIPAWISGELTIYRGCKVNKTGLPAEFLSTPFGQAMRPQIDAMFRRTAPTEHPVNSTSAPGPSTLPTPPISGSSTPAPLASSLLNAVAASATTGPTPAPTPPRQNPEISALTLISSSSNFSSILKQHQAVIVNFTNTPSCPPCRVIKPIYEAIANEYSPTYGLKGARFVEVELGVGEGRDIAGKYGVSATPTFMFFRNEKKVDELRGASKKELEVKVESFLEDTWPRHPHRKVYLAQLEKLPINPITSANAPNFTALSGKLETFGVTDTELDTIKSKVVPLLEAKSTIGDQELRSIVGVWTTTSNQLVSTLKPEQTFPLVDLWRIGLLNPRLAAVLALQLNASEVNAVTPILSLASTTLKSQGAATPKPFLLTVLRLVTNLLASLPIANLLLFSFTDTLIGIIVDSLLHPDNVVRSAAAGAAYNLSAVRHRDAKERGSQPEDGEEKEWEVELVSALVEGVGREADEDVAHRLLAALGLAIFLAPGFEESLKPLLEVLDAKGTLEGKMKTWKKPEVKKLALELMKVC